MIKRIQNYDNGNLIWLGYNDIEDLKFKTNDNYSKFNRLTRN